MNDTDIIPYSGRIVKGFLDSGIRKEDNDVQV